MSSSDQRDQERIEERAGEARPEEGARADPEGQAQALLAESDERSEHPEAIERRSSDMTVEP
jgi:hypothetical protein